jgi:hypothetical protein
VVKTGQKKSAKHDTAHRRMRWSVDYDLRTGTARSLAPTVAVASFGDDPPRHECVARVDANKSFASPNTLLINRIRDQAGPREC